MEATVYDKFRKVKDEIKSQFRKLDDKKLFKMTAKLATWHYPNKRTKQMTLSKDEAMLYEFYINGGYNPSTVYKWILACSMLIEIPLFENIKILVMICCFSIVNLLFIILTKHVIGKSSISDSGEKVAEAVKYIAMFA